MSETRDAVHPLRSLVQAVDGLEPDSELRASVDAAIGRGTFRPEEDERLIGWFARMLTVRVALWDVIEDATTRLGGRLRGLHTDDEWRAFLTGYCAACLVVKIDRTLVEDLATHTLVQRKLNEGNASHRLPRKQFTAIWESLADAQGALSLQQAMRVARWRRMRIEALADDPVIGFLVRDLSRLESALDPSRRNFFARVKAFLSHAVRRSFASGKQHALFHVMETSGTVVSELRDRRHVRRVDERLRRELGSLLEPGDVLITRRERVATNLFLPGYWPHAALYVGSAEDRDARGVEIDADRASRWTGDRCVLEALKDGVLFRRLSETLDVDAVAVLRPRLSADSIARGIERAVVHEGKGYNFDFDFFRSDRLVCSEVVYRAYDGLGDMAFELSERAGRPTLSAEDLLDAALAGPDFNVVAAFGAPGCEDRILRGDEAAAVLRGLRSAASHV